MKVVVIVATEAEKWKITEVDEGGDDIGGGSAVILIGEG